MGRRETKKSIKEKNEAAPLKKNRFKKEKTNPHLLF